MENKAKYKKIMLIGVLILVSVLMIISLFAGDFFKDIMGNSIYSNVCCEDVSSELKGNQYFKEEEIDSILLGNMNNDRIINEVDLHIITNETKNMVYGLLTLIMKIK